LSARALTKVAPPKNNRAARRGFTSITKLQTVDNTAVIGEREQRANEPVRLSLCTQMRRILPSENEQVGLEADFPAASFTCF
jgi:hypothetical protein